jgi:hypothetical protein
MRRKKTSLQNEEEEEMKKYIFALFIFHVIALSVWINTNTYQNPPYKKCAMELHWIANVVPKDAEKFLAGKIFPDIKTRTIGSPHSFLSHLTNSQMQKAGLVGLYGSR